MASTQSSAQSSATISQLIDRIINTKQDAPDFDLDQLIANIDSFLALCKAKKVSEYTGDEHSAAISVLRTAGNVKSLCLLLVNRMDTIKTLELLLDTINKNKKETLELLNSINELAKVVRKLKEMPRAKDEMLIQINESIALIVRGANLCCSLKKTKGFKRFLSALKARDDLIALRSKVKEMYDRLDRQISVYCLSILQNSNQPRIHWVEHADLQMAPVGTIKRNGIAGSGRIAEMEPGLSSNQELSLVSTHIYSNLTINQIAFIKSCCHGSLQVGKGSFARVYRGSFQGKDLAIKEIEHRSPDIKKWVENEVELLQGKEHININKLYAWCIEANISYLAYMYIDGCSLDDYLRGNCRGFFYSWKQSLGMIMGIARGIEFLHSNKIIHVDIKPQNIMVLEKDNEAKLVDFGFSRHVNWEGTHRSIDKIIGTKGYWAPEYCIKRKISYKQDVYSFGIVVLEMITGQRHVDGARGSSQFHIPDYVRHMIEKNRFEEAVDSRLKQDGWDIFAVKEAFAVANIALRCADPDNAGRPDMNVVVTELTSMVSTGH